MPSSSIIDHLKADLLAARKAHDRVRSEAIRSVLAAISNKEAVPLGASQKTYQIHEGVGSTEATRRTLSDQDIRQIIQDEIDEIQAAINGIGEHAERQYVNELKQKLAILTAYLSIFP